jgi:2-keto-3-deoxy-L-rhamnonate aldolase RhmA
MQCFSGSAALVEIIGYAGFDFVMLDTEHSPIEPSRVIDLVRAADGVNLTTLVRVAENSPTLIRGALEAGAAGVIIPQVRSAQDVRDALDAARYPPVGSRGMCPSTRAARYALADWDEYVTRTNSGDVLVIPLLEHPDAIANAEDICGADGVEVVFFGPGDLSMSLGLGSTGLRNPEVRKAFDRLLSVAEQTDTKVMGIPYPDASIEACQDMIDQGVKILVHSSDELLFSDMCRSIVRDLTAIARPYVSSS